jgi:diguanylate cyclase (GGDEF)-like protein
MTGTSTNVSKRKLAEERAEYLATRDPLTGLPNRMLLHDRLDQGVLNATRHQAGFAFMFIDLDRFKTINDSLGHQAGDELLKGVAARLTACVRATDTVARLGGDEFAVILENLRDDDDEGAQQVAEKMIAAMAAPMLVDNQPLSTSCSIGISLYPADGRDSASLMKNADVAMYYAKEKGRNNYQFFSAEMNARAQERLSVENYLRLALKRNELVLHYQPRMNLATGELVGVEALIRWQHPRRGLLAPEKFIDVAEDSGLIVAIGEWVLQNACEQIRVWQRLVKPGLRCSVNISVGQILDGERLYRAVAQAVSRARIEPAILELELTESHLMQNIEEKVGLLNRLGELGVGISIDDFGTGYSSLSYLKKLPVDSIKIDSSFVRDIEQDPNDEAIIKAILAMAHSLRLSVVAEGVETETQFRALQALGCDEFQGFFESPALAPADFEKRYGGGKG